MRLDQGSRHAYESIKARALRALLQSYAVSLSGSAVSFGVLTFVAVEFLDVSAASVSAMVAATTMAGAVMAVRVAPLVDAFPTRRVLILCELIQAASLLSLVAAFWLGSLTFVHLCLAACIQSGMSVVYMSGVGVAIKGLADPDDLNPVNSKVEVVNWTTMSLGPPLGGAVVALLGPVAALIADGVSFLGAALLLRRLPRSTSGPHENTIEAPSGGVLAGYRHIRNTPVLARLFVNAMLFGGSVMMMAPLLAVFILRDLNLTAWQYGLALGVPSVCGLVGSILSPRFASWTGTRRGLLMAGAARTPWYLALIVAPDGAVGLIVVMAVESALLFSAGVFNPLFSTTRMQLTPESVLGRVGAAWSATAKVFQPACILAGGVIASTAGTRSAILCAGILCLSSCVFLPWRCRWETSEGVTTPSGELIGLSPEDRPA